MKLFKNRFNYLPFILALLMFLHSCSVYNKTPITLKEAVSENKEVLIKTMNGEKYRMKGLEMIDGRYYGYTYVKHEKVKVPFDQDNIESIRSKNTGNSVFVTVLFVTGIVIGGIFALFAAGG